MIMKIINDNDKNTVIVIKIIRIILDDRVAGVRFV